MQGTDIILRAMDDTGTKQTELGKLLGMSRQQVNRMVRKSEGITIQTFAKSLDKLGYKVIVVPKHTKMEYGWKRLEW